MIPAFYGLEEILNNVPQKLAGISDELATVKPLPQKWSKKEILGHLIDSAANNHQRFVRMQSSDFIQFPTYQQENWVSVQQWQSRSWTDIINLWLLYNQHILHIFKYIPAHSLQNTVQLGEGIYTLAFISDDYVSHLQHHLQQIIDL
ncbi:DinB family protein [Limnovirga soli]|uniref:DinB family protein n=1 Tax=Limnovirga soli TaxID=2656915 RepID=A0A8J8JUN5_9BACT|nr:DinB family protein [Limnovirga soli]NNV55759.1 DinB family protein [Limnovirga soli]